MDRFDIAVIGAGMAGATLAAELAPQARVLLLEAEAQPGYHATGRSAAFWSETYGGPHVTPLTLASHGALAGGGFLRPRGCIHLAGPAGGPALDRLLDAFADTAVSLHPLDRAGLEAAIPGLRGAHDRGVSEPSCSDIDVAALHADALARARRARAELRVNARVASLARSRGRWRLAWSGGAAEAEVVVDAAGAWSDEVARMAGVAPLGLQPFRRTMAQVRVEPAVPADLPLIMDAEGRFYLKPEAGGRLWITPHDEIPAPAGDAAAEEVDVALAIARVEAAVDWRVVAVERRWAGLRTFAPDRLPVYGFDRAAPGFFWFAGQGGFGIQTAPAAARLAAALVTRGRVDDSIAAIDPAVYAPSRFG